MAKNELNERAEEIEKLVARAQKGDHDSFAELYDIFIDPIYRYVFYRVNSADAEDVVETVFVKVWENLRQYKRRKKSFSAWIFRIAHNLVVDYYRASKDGQADELGLHLPDQNREHNPVKKTQDVLSREILKVAVSKLKKQYQDIIVYKFVNDFSNRELADIMDKSEGSLRILQFRALQALKRELKNMGVEY